MVNRWDKLLAEIDGEFNAKISVLKEEKTEKKRSALKKYGKLGERLGDIGCNFHPKGEFIDATKTLNSNFPTAVCKECVKDSIKEGIAGSRMGGNYKQVDSFKSALETLKKKKEIDVKNVPVYEMLKIESRAYRCPDCGWIYGYPKVMPLSTALLNQPICITNWKCKACDKTLFVAYKEQ